MQPLQPEYGHGQPGPSPYFVAPAPTPPKKSRKGLIWAIIFFFLAFCFFGIAVIAASGSGSSKSAPSTATSVAARGVTPTAEPASTGGVATSRPLRPSDLALSVKVSEKQCFGSAGCNVQFTIKADLLTNIEIEGPCEVTYEVKGLDGPQTNTLTVYDSDNFTQDGFQFGMTETSKVKLSARVTDVECG